MKRFFFTFVGLLLFATGIFAQTPTAPTTSLKAGDKAPDFELSSTAGDKLKLSDFRGKKNVVLAFYVLAFTGG
jgi:peroxiredoxin